MGSLRPMRPLERRGVRASTRTAARKCASAAERPQVPPQFQALQRRVPASRCVCRKRAKRSSSVLQIWTDPFGRWDRFFLHAALYSLCHLHTKCWVHDAVVWGTTSGVLSLRCWEAIPTCPWYEHHVRRVMEHRPFRREPFQVRLDGDHFHASSVE